MNAIFELFNSGAYVLERGLDLSQFEKDCCQKPHVSGGKQNSEILEKFNGHVSDDIMDTYPRSYEARKRLHKMSSYINKEIAFSLRQEGKTVREIALEIGVSTRTIFKWFSSQTVEIPQEQVPKSFDEALAVLSDATAVEVAAALVIAKSGRGASQRIWRLSKTMSIIKMLSEAGEKVPIKTSEEMQELREKLQKRLNKINLDN